MANKNVALYLAAVRNDMRLAAAITIPGGRLPYQLVT